MPRRTAPERLDADMTPSGIVAALARMEFHGDFRSSNWTAAMLDYLIAAVPAAPHVIDMPMAKATKPSNKPCSEGKCVVCGSEVFVLGAT